MKTRTSVSIEESLLEKARKEGINLSEFLERSLSSRDMDRYRNITGKLLQAKELQAQLNAVLSEIAEEL